jgi:hypothetical protein
MDGIESKNKLTQYIEIIEDEVLDGLYLWLCEHGQRKLSETMKRPDMKSILRLLVIKTIININQKNGLEKQFINELLGEEIFLMGEKWNETRN